MTRNKKLESSLEGLFSKPRGKSPAPEASQPENIPSDPAPSGKDTAIPQASAENAVHAVQPAQSTSKPAAQDPATPVRPPSGRASGTTKPNIKNSAKKPVEKNSPVEKAPTSPQPPAQVSAQPPVELHEEKPVSVFQPPAEEPAARTEPQPDTSIENINPEASALNPNLREEEKQVLIFRMQEVDYGIEIGTVQTIIKPQSVFLVPGTDEFIKGLINLRGDVVPVVDLRTRFGLPHHPEDKDTRFVVVEIGDMRASLVVDAVQGVATIPLRLIEDPNKLVSDIETRYLEGIAHLDDQLVLILNLGETIRSKVVRVA